MIRGVIFDLDGLLMNTEIISYTILKGILDDFGHDFSMKDYAMNYSGIPEEINVTNIIKNFKLPVSFQGCFNRVMETEAKLHKKGVDLMPGAIKLLTYLKNNNIKIALASSSTKKRADNLLKQHDILDMFDVFVLAEDVHHGKPDPEVFLKAQQKLQVTKQECFVLEDSENGIEAGYRAQIPVICVPDVKVPKENILKKATYVVKSLEKVIDIIENS